MTTEELIQQRDAFEERINQIADALGDKSEWTNQSDRGANALELAEQLKARAERAECQLAGCGAAALGYGGECQKGDYGWTPAFDDIVSLRSKVLVKRIRELEHLIDLQRRKIGALEGELDAAKSDARFGHDLAKGRAERIRVACAELDNLHHRLTRVRHQDLAEFCGRIARELEGKDSPGEHPEKAQDNGRNGTDDTGPRIPQPLVREEAGAECDDTDLSGDGRGADAAGAPSETGDAAGERGDGARRTRAPGGGGVHGQQVDSDSGQPASMSEQSRSESTRAGCSSPPTGGLLDSPVIRDLVTVTLGMQGPYWLGADAEAAAKRLRERYPR